MGVNHDALVEYVNSVYDGAAKAHEFALPSPQIFKVQQEVRIGVDPGLPLPRCRWCAGDGLDPFLPTRIRQFLTCAPWCISSDPGGHSEYELLLPDVNEWLPLNEWVENMSGHLPRIARSPFDLIGMTYVRVRCKRCRGTGRPTGTSS